MTPSQLIKKEAIEQMILENYYIHEGDITTDNVENIYNDMYSKGLVQDFLYDFREGQIATLLETEYSRHYESTAVAAQMSNGVWVGWTYWYGGGKYAEPEAIDWMGEAYFLDCKEEEKMVVVHTFTKKD